MSHFGGAKIHPETKVFQLSATKRKLLYEELRTVLLLAIEKGAPQIEITLTPREKGKLYEFCACIPPRKTTVSTLRDNYFEDESCWSWNTYLSALPKEPSVIRLLTGENEYAIASERDALVASHIEQHESFRSIDLMEA